MSSSNAPSETTDDFSSVPSVLSQIPMLRIVGGPLTGSAMRINLDTRLTIGNALGNDIVFRDGSVAGKQIDIVVTSSSIELNVLKGEALVGGETLFAGETCHTGNQSLQLGNVEFEIQLAGPDEHAESTARIGLADSAFAADTLKSTTDKTHEIVSDAVKSTPSSLRSLSLISSVAVIGLVVGILIIGQYTGVSADSDKSLSVEALLEDSPFSTLALEKSNGQVIVSGLVDSRESAIALASLLQKSNETVLNKTQIGAVMADRVVDIFRVNGVEADAIATGLGEVTANTSVADPDQLEELQEIVRVDFPQLEKLLINNTPPLLEEQEPLVSTPQIVEDPGKRVSMVVSHAPAHVVTEDRSRYFIGSLLPTGHRIAAIDAGRVSLEKGGVTTELKF